MDSKPAAGGERPPYHLARPWTIAWAIAWRHIKESLHNRSTYVMAVFFLFVPLGLAGTTLGPLTRQAGLGQVPAQAGVLVALYLLMAGLLPCTWSVGIAAGAFAAEKEQGSLVPLLATPASNGAIFAGKVLGAVLPSLVMSTVNVALYLLEIGLLFGAGVLALMPAGLLFPILLLLPAASLFGAGLSSAISARVRTEQIANQYGSIILSLTWFVLFGLLLRAPAWGAPAFTLAVLIILVGAVVLILVSAATWRREEVMARQ